MTKAEYETKCFVDEKVARYHKRTGKHPSATDVRSAIRKARLEHLQPPKAYWDQNVMQQRTYARFAALELMHRIEDRPDEAPIRVIYEFLDYLDDRIALSDSRYVWTFVGAMTSAINEILELLT